MNIRSDDTFVFAPEAAPAEKLQTSIQPIKILSVEDNLHYQEALLLGLRSLTYESAPLEILTAGSATQASDVIARNPDISVILLDVVMEEDDAGLHLVNTIRNVMGDNMVRIVLLTGQPGFAPRRDVMRDYDINEYWQKSELDAEKLRAVILSNIRSWKALHDLTLARQGLELLIAATRSLSAKTDLKQFSQALLSEINKLIDTPRGGIVCTHGQHDNGLPDEVIAASGEFKQKEQAELFQGELQQLYESARKTRAHQFNERYNVLFFDTQQADKKYYLMVVESEKPLDNYSINLLQAFSENASTGFSNVALLNRVTQLAYYDEVLNIPNRTAFYRELELFTDAERRHAQLITIEIQNFSEIMLMAGSKLATSLLHEVHRHLKHTFKQHRLLARTSKDAFTLILDQAHIPDELSINLLSNRPLEVAGMELHAQFHLVHLDMQLLEPSEMSQVLHLVEAALAVCRMEKRNLLSVTPAFKGGILKRYSLLQDLNKALFNDELFIALQPQINMQTGKLAGFEALVRWQRASGEFISPAEFIPVAEASGLVTQIDTLVMRKTIETISKLYTKGYAAPCSFNVANADLRSGQFLAHLFEKLDTLEFPARLLGIEITESEAMENYDQINPTLKQLIARGVEIYIDDFGTGHSSLAHITQLAATHLKIDQSFVSAMLNNSDGEHVVDMIIRLGQRFDFGIVAEGVETQQQLEKLAGKGCHVAQGFLVARPMPFDELVPWLEEHFPVPQDA